MFNVVARRAVGVRGVGRSGFTLIELLVVVAIIALLIAILLPSLGKARERARIAYCSSNCRQICVAYRTYLAYFGGKGIYYYRDQHDPPDPTLGYSNTEWMGGLRPYGIKDKV